VNLFTISVAVVIIITSISEDGFFNLSTVVTSTDNVLRLSYSQLEQEIVSEQKTFSNESAQDKNSATIINNTLQGTLVVTTKVNNEGGGSSEPSDFTIKVHGNNPSISSFPGNSSGTVVKLDMGMYSVTASGPPFYNSTSSMECSGAVMSSETIKCDIYNTYAKPIS
jgi:Prealbumin-like fold domain